MLDPDPLDDVNLLLRIAKQDKQAFSILFDRYALKLKAFMMRSGMSGEDADEIAQDVMVSVWRKAHLYDPAKAGAATWIYTIARNRRIDVLRKHARPAPDPDDPLFQPDPLPGGREVMSAQETQDAVRLALHALPADQRQVLICAYFDGLSHGEVAGKLDLPLGTVKSRIRLACKAMRGILGEDRLADLYDD